MRREDEGKASANLYGSEWGDGEDYDEIMGGEWCGSDDRRWVLVTTPSTAL